MKAAWIGLSALACVAVGCRGEELARVALTAPGQTSTATWTTSGAANASVWIDYDGEWVGREKDPGLSYVVEVDEGATRVQTLTCATSSCRTHVCGSTVSINDRHDSDCECKTDCVVAIPRAGTFTVRATVTNPAGGFSGKNASLVLRQ